MVTISLLLLLTKIIFTRAFQIQKRLPLLKNQHKDNRTKHWFKTETGRQLGQCNLVLVVFLSNFDQGTHLSIFLVHKKVFDSREYFPPIQYNNRETGQV